MAYWDLGDFFFVEHLAVAKDYQGKRLGSRIMSEFVENANKRIVFEVEDPNSMEGKEKLDAQRRIMFYLKLGFYVNSSCLYRQPVLNKETDDKPPILILVSSRGPLTEKQFHFVHKCIMREIYHVKFS